MACGAFAAMIPFVHPDYQGYRTPFARDERGEDVPSTDENFRRVRDDSRHRLRRGRSRAATDSYDHSPDGDARAAGNRNPIAPDTNAHTDGNSHATPAHRDTHLRDNGGIAIAHAI